MIFKRIIIFCLFIFTLIGCELVELPPEIIIDFTYDATQEDITPPCGYVDIEYTIYNRGDIDLNNCALEFVVDCTPDSTFSQWTSKVDLYSGETYEDKISINTFTKLALDIYVNAVGMDRPPEEEE